MPLTTAGWQVRTQAEIAVVVAARLGALLGITVPVADATDPLGRLVQAFAAELADLELSIAAAFGAHNPASQSGAQLDRILASFGTRRRAERAARARVRLAGTPTLNLAGLVAADPDGGLWVLPDGAVIGATGTVEVEAEAAETGPRAPTLGAWTLTGSPPTGFTSVIALEVTGAGADPETDPDARARLEVLRAMPSATEAGIYAALLEVPGVDAASLRIYNNREPSTSVQGVPGHHVEALVEGGADTEIASALATSASHTAGFFGTTEALGSWETSAGTTVSVRVYFTRPTAARAFARAYVVHTGAPADLPADATAVVADAITTYAAGRRVGDLLLGGEAAAAVVAALPAQSVVAVTVEFAAAAVGPWNGSLSAGFRAYPRVSAEPSGAYTAGSVAAPYNITAGWQLDVSVLGGATQSVIFPTIVNGTAQDVVDEIVAAGLTDISGLVSADSTVALLGDATGAAAYFTIEGTSTLALLSALGLGAGIYYGLDSDVVLVSVL